MPQLPIEVIAYKATLKCDCIKVGHSIRRERMWVAPVLSEGVSVRVCKRVSECVDKAERVEELLCY